MGCLVHFLFSVVRRGVLEIGLGLCIDFEYLHETCGPGSWVGSATVELSLS